MPYAQTAEEKYQKMITTPVSRLICGLAVPTIATMLITSIYNMADTFFVGKIGTSATGAVGVAFALMAMIQAIGFTLGQGSGNYISRLLGGKDTESASRVASTGFFSALILGVFLMALGLIFLDPLVRALGATETIAPYAKDYVRFILIGMPYMAASLVLNNLLRFQGSAFYGMLGIGAGGLLNIGLDPLFIFTFGMGVAGAALATILSQLVSFFILLFNCGLGGNIKIRFRDFTPTWEIYREILRGGLPSFYRQGLASVSTTVLNFCAGPYGDAAIAAMSIVSRVAHFAMSAMLGFGQGYQPVCGFNYGAKRYDRVLRGFWFCVRVSLVVLAMLGAAGVAFAPQIIAVFQSDPQVVEFGTRALRYQSLTLVASAWIVPCNMMMQTIGRGTKASLLSLARQGLFLLPMLLLLPPLLGAAGIQLAQPAADVLSCLFAIPLSIGVIRELKVQEK